MWDLVQNWGVTKLGITFRVLNGGCIAKLLHRSTQTNSAARLTQQWIAEARNVERPRPAPRIWKMMKDGHTRNDGYIDLCRYVEMIGISVWKLPPTIPKWSFLLRSIIVYGHCLWPFETIFIKEVKMAIWRGIQKMFNGKSGGQHKAFQGRFSH